METIGIRRAALADLNELVELLDAYRHSYGCKSDRRAARRFLLDRFEHSESVVFLALLADKAVGFVQLYPCFSTVALGRTFILNDLYVSPEARRKGVGKRLLNAATQYAKQHGAIRLTLSSEIDDSAARALYRSYGWKRDERFLVYELKL